MIRYYFALWMAKLSLIVLRITKHNGTNFPGIVALKLCPDFLSYIKKPEKIIGVTGTNGKTTCVNLLKDALANNNIHVLSNGEGSNIKTGIATLFMKGVNIFGHCKYDMAVLEIDERSAPILFKAFEPELLVINNLTRDSIMRNGHPEYIARILSEEIPAKTRLLINGDDLIACSVAPDNERRYFGIEKMDTDVAECINLINDMRICPKCRGMLKYDYLRYHHIGRAYCPECGFHSPDYDYAAKDVDTANMTFKVGDTEYKLFNDSVFNIYNAVAVVATLLELNFSEFEVQKMLEGVDIVATRYNEKKFGSYSFVRQMSKDKNALASSRVFDYISTRPGDKELIMMMNCMSDIKTWSENMCWLYDCDFELLNDESVKNIIVTGVRAKDYCLRLKMAGIPDDRITVFKDEMDAPSGLKLFSGSSIYLLYGTDSLDLSYKVSDKIEMLLKAAAEKEAEGLPVSVNEIIAEVEGGK